MNEDTSGSTSSGAVGPTGDFDSIVDDEDIVGPLGDTGVPVPQNI